MHMNMTARTGEEAASAALIVGHGLIGGSLRARLREAAELPVVCIGRRHRELPDYRALDQHGILPRPSASNRRTINACQRVSRAG